MIPVALGPSCVPLVPEFRSPAGWCACIPERSGQLLQLQQSQPFCSSSTASSICRASVQTQRADCLQNQQSTTKLCALALSSADSLQQEPALLGTSWAAATVSFLELDLAQSAGQSGSDKQRPEADQKEARPSGESYLEFPARPSDVSQPEQPSAPSPPKTMRVRLSVHYRVHSRQMLCIGGSQIPFGWSFLSISKLPMVWSEGDVWTAEVDLPVNSRMDYKYVILEEQDWTKQESEDAEGVVTFRYREKPEDPPDVQTIQKQMAIVAWQPGPNRVVQVPSEGELNSLQRGEVRERTPARMPARPYLPRRFPGGSLGQALQNIKPPSMRSPPPPRKDPQDDELAGTWEMLSRDEDSGEPLLERRDVWGMSDLQPPSPIRFG